MGMPVRELLGRVTSREIAEWMAFYGMEPFGDRRGDMQAALVSSTMANAFRSSDSEPYNLKDFLFDFDQQAPREATQEELDAKADMFAAAFGLQRVKPD